MVWWKIVNAMDKALRCASEYVLRESFSLQQVDGSGNAQVTIPGRSFAAFHVGGIAPPSNTTTEPPRTTQATTPNNTGPRLYYFHSYSFSSGNRTRTVIFVYRPTQPGQDMFIMGGTAAGHGYTCTSNTDTDPCALPITHRTKVPASFTTYLDWERGDLHLDMHGAEPGQG